jgi:hypothetical protein
MTAIRALSIRVATTGKVRTIMENRGLPTFVALSTCTETATVKTITTITEILEEVTPHRRVCTVCTRRTRRAGAQGERHGLGEVMPMRIRT